METLLLIFLTGFIFYKLWSVLGTRTGNEKQNHDWVAGQYNDSNVQNTDNVIILSKTNIAEKPDSQQNEKEDILNKINELVTKGVAFDIDAFTRGATRAFEKIVMSFTSGELEKIKNFVTDDVYAKFEDAVAKRNSRKESVEIEIQDIIATVIDMNVGMIDAKITVQFQSEQILVTLDENGVSNDNPARLKTTVIDTWVFTRSYTDSCNVWLLCGTEVR